LAVSEALSRRHEGEKWSSREEKCPKMALGRLVAVDVGISPLLLCVGGLINGHYVLRKKEANVRREKRQPISALKTFFPRKAKSGT